MAFYAIVGMRAADDGLPNSWQPDVPPGVTFSTISLDSTITVDQLRRGVPTSGRRCIVRTPNTFLSPSVVVLGDDLDSAAAVAGVAAIETLIGASLPIGSTARGVIVAVVESWDDEDDTKPNALRPGRDGRIRVRLGPDMVMDRKATATEIERRSRQAPARLGRSRS